MRFDFTEEHRLLQRNVRTFLEKECVPEVIRDLSASESGRSPELWQKLAEIGLPQALVPEEQGGLGLSEMDLVLLLEEIGRVALAEPVVETAAVGVPLLRDAKARAFAERWLPKVAEGAAVLTVGHPINPVVADAHVADVLLLERDGEIHAVERNGVKALRQPCSDPSRRLFTIDWKPSAETRLASGDEARRLLDAALDRAALAIAAQQVGLGQRMVEIAVDYAKQREQFGKPIGSFQAVKHLLANVQVKLEFARPVVYRAAHSVAHGTPTRAADVSQANVAASDAALAAARTALQVHGAIGYTWEVDLHLWMKRTWALEASFGSRRWHRARVASLVLDAKAAAPSFGFTARIRP